MTAGHDRAFPSPSKESYFEGLNKRELFAAMIMHGYCANTHSLEEQTSTNRAEQSVIEADALIDAINKQKASADKGQLFHSYHTTSFGCVESGGYLTTDEDVNNTKADTALREAAKALVDQIKFMFPNVAIPPNGDGPNHHFNVFRECWNAVSALLDRGAKS